MRTWLWSCQATDFGNATAAAMILSAARFTSTGSLTPSSASRRTDSAARARGLHRVTGGARSGAGVANSNAVAIQPEHATAGRRPNHADRDIAHGDGRRGLANRVF